jgi:hypothetical protein
MCTPSCWIDQLILFTGVKTVAVNPGRGGVCSNMQFITANEQAQSTEPAICSYVSCLMSFEVSFSFFKEKLIGQMRV